MTTTPAERLQREERKRMRAETFAHYALAAQRIAIAIATLLLSSAVTSAVRAAMRAPF